MEYFERFGPRNIANYADLEAQIKKTKALCNGLDPESLRDDEALRNRVRSQFETIKNTVDTMVVLKPSRDVSFSDDDA